MVEVFIWGRAENQYVVDVYKDKFKVTADFVHKTLESLSRIAKSIGHTLELKEAKRCDECCFWDILWSDRYLMVSPDEVDLGEYCATWKAGRKVLNMWNWVTIWFSGGIDSPIVTTRAPVTVRLRDHVKRRRPVTRRYTYGVRSHHLIKLSFSSSKLFWRKASSLREVWWSSGYNVVLNVVLGGWLSDARFTDGWKLSKNGVKLVGRLGKRYVVEMQWHECRDLCWNCDRCHCINETGIGDVNKNTKVSQEVCSQNRLVHVSDEKIPPELPVEAKIQGEVALAISMDN